MKTIFKLKATEEEKRELKIEFDRLETIEEKYAFWKEKFNFSYFFWANVEYVEFQDFIIHPSNREDREILNKLIYKEGNFLPAGNRFPHLNKWKREFETNYEISPNKENVINYELKKIDDYVTTKKTENEPLHGSSLNTNPFFVGGFEMYLLREEEFDWGERQYQPMNLIALLRGIELAKYREFVSNYSKSIKDTGGEIKLTHDQQILILEYMGLANNIEDKKARSKYYGALLNRSCEITRQKLSKIEGFRSSRNLKKILSYFDSLGLLEQSELVKEDLKKIS